jgi:uncharacterized repeat protein (TIGR01451 family)
LTDPTDTEVVDLADPAPAIALVKTGTYTAPAGGSIPGETITYAFTVTNTGNVTLTNVIITDPLVTVSGGPLATLAPGVVDATTFTATYALTQADIDAGTFTNIATVTGTPPTGAPVTDTDDDTQTMNEQPSILLVKSVDDATDVTAGQVLTYTYMVTNNGNTTLNNVSVADIHNGTGTLGTISPAVIASLAPLAVTIFTATYTVTQEDIDLGIAITNTATATGTSPTGTTVNDSDNQSVAPATQAPAIALVKTGTIDDGGDGIVDAGDVINYIFTVTNTGMLR